MLGGMSVAKASLTLANTSPGEDSTDLGDGTEHAAGRSHHQCRRHALARGVPHDEPQPAVFELEEVVEVSSHLPSRLVVSALAPSRRARGSPREGAPVGSGERLAALARCVRAPGPPQPGSAS